MRRNYLSPLTESIRTEGQQLLIKDSVQDEPGNGIALVRHNLPMEPKNADEDFAAEEENDFVWGSLWD